MHFWGKFTSGVFFTLFTSMLHTPLSAQLKVMTIGDSLTEEYYFEFTFSAPSSALLIPGSANTKNWVEILAEQRPSDLDFGDYEDSWPFGYSDWRQAGYAYNFGIPGYDTEKWMAILNPGINPLDPDFDILAFPTRSAMRDTYEDMDAVIVMVGGNDVNFQYGDLYNALPEDAFATSFITQVISNLGEIIDEIKDFNAAVPIILANIPDLGTTPDIMADHPDASKRANATAIINDLNIAVAALALNRNLTLAPISNLTDMLYSSDPIYIGGHQMIKGTDPNEDNRPQYLFCWQGLHPSTNGQAIMANILLDALNTATGSSIEKLESREILTDLLELNPDQPYLDWASTKGLSNTSMTADPDGDGIPNLGEYILGLEPQSIDYTHNSTVKSINGSNYLTLKYTPNTEALRLADGSIKYSTDLSNWLELPNNWLLDLNNGTHEAQLPIRNLPDHADRAFLRMEFTLKP